jgi:hypothetical protein
VIALAISDFGERRRKASSKVVRNAGADIADVLEQTDQIIELFSIKAPA